MFSEDQMNELLQQVMSRINKQNDENSNCIKKDSKNNCKKLSLTPSEGLVILGILGGVLDVLSVLVDKDQAIQIVLSGSLKQKTPLDKMLDQIGSMPFDEVVKAMLGRL